MKNIEKLFEEESMITFTNKYCNDVRALLIM